MGHNGWVVGQAHLLRLPHTNDLLCVYSAGIPYNAPPERNSRKKAIDPQCLSLKYIGCMAALANQSSEININRLLPRGVVSSSFVCASEMYANKIKTIVKQRFKTCIIALLRNDNERRSSFQLKMRQNSKWNTAKAMQYMPPIVISDSFILMFLYT